MPTEASMLRYYARRAPEYDSVYAKPERQPDLRHLRAWLPSLFAGRRVFEVACGTGYWTHLIASVAEHVVAMDAAPQVLDVAARRLAELDAGRFRLVLGDAYAPPQGLGRCDAAFAGFWFSHVPRSRRRAFLLGLEAVLGPGAEVVLLDNRFVPGSSSPLSDRDAEGNTFQERVLADGSRHRVLKNFPERAELEAELDGIGTPSGYTELDHYWVLRYRIR